ncbi:sulfite exporter TauE/SafE family protein [Teredinibacter turnerae]|uniref:sulfite exporter TauE/SafE family protein n=1 Tax=Teredinibacter turnerae TaxID=2426 RepID=UPI00048E4B71|nr:sulfite exporter TauE/SafE family protein [Teredinibacter turnerae]
MDLIFYIFAGAGVGLAVGLTGVGGGSLMTPILILSGVPQKIAIGTDLLYAAVTKTGAMHAHHRQGTVRWKLVLTLASGSIPASLITTLTLRYLIPESFDYGPFLTHSLGSMLIMTSAVVFFKKRIQGTGEEPHTWFHRQSTLVTFASGVLLGIFVTLSSVGAGAFCAALLLLLYPRLPALQVVGTDIAHAVPLTLIAGLGHLWNDNVDFNLLFGLLLGSVPAVHLGAKLAAKIPNTVLQPILAVILLVIGIKFAFFPIGAH